MEGKGQSTGSKKTHIREPAAKGKEGKVGDEENQTSRNVGLTLFLQRKMLVQFSIFFRSFLQLNYFFEYLIKIIFSFFYRGLKFLHRIPRLLTDLYTRTRSVGIVIEEETYWRFRCSP